MFGRDEKVSGIRLTAAQYMILAIFLVLAYGLWRLQVMQSDYYALAAEKNRIQKVLEVANVKLGNIVSDVFGVSGQAMVSELLSGRELEAGKIADLAKRRLRQRIPELTEALLGHQVNDHHRG